MNGEGLSLQLSDAPRITSLNLSLPKFKIRAYPVIDMPKILGRQAVHILYHLYSSFLKAIINNEIKKEMCRNGDTKIAFLRPYTSHSLFNSLKRLE